MSVGWIKTEEQRERHKAGCRARHRSHVEQDPDYNKKNYRIRRMKLEANSEALTESRRQSTIASKRSYMRHRDRRLRPDQTKRESVVIALGGKCVRCGYEADIRALCLDHKNGNGAEDRSRLGSKIARYYCTRIEEAKETLQVLCANCNTIKAIEEKEHNRSRRIAN